MYAISFVPIVPLRRYLFFIIIILLVSSPFFVIVYQQIFVPYQHEPSRIYNYTPYDKFCLQIDQRLDLEQTSNASIEIDPSKGSIPYSYSQWRSTSLMPRLLTRCEHAIYIHLLSILTEHVFQKYNIQYMMMAATLIGSYTRHDILPWDDDVDLGVFLSDRKRLQSIIQNELSSKHYSIMIMQMYNERNYDKIFFSWTPRIAGIPWRFPFIDIFYYDQNSTHISLLGKPSSCPVLREDVLPLVLRPLGPLWLYAPREPMAHFESRKMFKIENGCFASSYSHKYERFVRGGNLYVDCSLLTDVYPYVIRQCISSRCTEYLTLGKGTTIHQLTYNYEYRTFLYAERNLSYRAC